MGILGNINSNNVKYSQTAKGQSGYNFYTSNGDQDFFIEDNITGTGDGKFT